MILINETWIVIPDRRIECCNLEGVTITSHGSGTENRTVNQEQSDLAIF